MLAKCLFPNLLIYQKLMLHETMWINKHVLFSHNEGLFYLSLISQDPQLLHNPKSLDSLWCHTIELLEGDGEHEGLNVQNPVLSLVHPPPFCFSLMQNTLQCCIDTKSHAFCIRFILFYSTCSLNLLKLVPLCKYLSHIRPTQQLGSMMLQIFPFLFLASLPLLNLSFLPWWNVSSKKTTVQSSLQNT